MAQVARSSSRCRSPFHSIKFFVLCHGLLQLALLLVSGYLKSSINTIERRYGFSSKKSGLLSSFNEVGSTFLIVFVSFFGSRVHRPRFIGLGALIASVASLIMAMPHFLGGLYKYTDHTAITNADNSSGLCQTESGVSVGTTMFADQNCGEEESTAEQWIYPILLTGQLLLGVGTVPIHPFGISYIDDFASKKTSPLYLGILLAVTCIGPAFGFIMGGFMLRFYVDIDKLSPDEIRLDPKDQRWVGAWWMGFMVASIILFIAALPYMFFPSRMPKEDGGEEDEPRTEKATDPKKEQTLIQFLKSFPSIALRTFRSPVYLLVVFAQVFMAALVVGVATFMAKFIERQFSLSFSIANMMIGGVVIPLAVLGIVLGGVVMRRLNLSVIGASRMCCIVVMLSILSAIPLLLIGCPTQKVAGVFPSSADPWSCNAGCNCNNEAFNPICGSDGIEFRSPCHAGCLAMKMDNMSQKVTNYSQCACVDRESGILGTAVPGTCGTWCTHLLLPFLVLAALTCFTASFSQTPSFMMILRTVDPEDKSFAVGVQYMLFRVLAFLPGPVLYGTVIDSACILWGEKCGKTTACRYYNMDHFRQRFFGVQAIFISAGLVCFLMVMTVLRRQTKTQSQDTGKEYELVNGEKRRESEVSSRQRPSLTT